MITNLETSWSKRHPFRVPDWRWRRAVYFLQPSESKSGANDTEVGRVIQLEESSFSSNPSIVFPSIPRTFDNDEEVVAALRFLFNLQTDKSVFPHQVHAFEIYSREAYTFIRWEIEARILVGQSDAEIADCLGIDPKTIETYEAWFYNIRDRRQNKSYIFQCLILPKIAVSSNEELSREAIWKMYAFFEDADILNQVIFDCTTTISKDNFWMDDFVGILFRRLSILCRFNKIDAPTVLREFAKIYKLKNDNSSTATRSELLTRIQEAISHIDWDWSDQTVATKKDNYMIGNASVKSSELAKLEDREPGAKFQELLNSMKFETQGNS